MQRIKESPPNKKLSLIYLANGESPQRSLPAAVTDAPFAEIVQQSKIRKKDEFVKAYDPIIAEATAAAYRGSSSDVQNKIRRVVEVWRQRLVFSPHIQQQVEAAIDELDRNRSSKKPALGGSLFSSSSVPPELAPVAPLATSLQKADINAKPATTAASQEYDKLISPSYVVPSPPMHAAGLSALVKKLATAEGAVAESIKARQALITGLEKLLQTNRAKLSADQDAITDLTARKVAIEGRKREVEEGILKGLTGAEAQAISAAPLAVSPGPRSNLKQDSAPPVRPDMEELTPPPMESFTPTGSPRPFVPEDVFPEPAALPLEPHAVPPRSNIQSSAAITAIGAINDQLQGTNVVMTTATHAAPIDGQNGANAYYQPTYKKRKMSRSAAEDEFAAFAGDGDIDGIDANVGDLI